MINEYIYNKIKAILDEENKAVADHFFNERCEKCNAHIEASINHYIDQFYKGLHYAFRKEFLIEELEGST